MRQVGTDSVVRALLINGHRLLLDSTFTLASVQAILGETTIIPPRNHDDYATECYAAVDSLGPFTIRLLSNELGGPEHVVLGFELTRGNASKPEVRTCSSIGVVREVKADNGLYLGMPVASLLKVMGRPKRSGRGEYAFEFYEVRKRTRDPGGETTVLDETTASVQAKVARDRVVGLRAWYTFASYMSRQQ